MLVSRRSFLTAAASAIVTSVVSARRAHGGPFGRQLEVGLEPVIGQAIEEVMVGMFVGVLVALPILLVAVLIDTFSKSLGLTRQQINALERLGDEALEDVKRFAALSAEERQRTLETFLKMLDEKYLPKLLANLTPKQTRRFQEIRLQFQGVVGLMDADVASELNLSDEQRKLIAQAGNKLKAMNLTTDDDLSFARRAAGALMSRKFAELQANAALTDEQRRKLMQLQGEPIHIEALLRKAATR